MITWHRGYVTQTVATVVIYALQSDASVTVTCNAGDVVMTSQSPGSVHQIYLATISGLSAGQIYQVTITVDAESESGEVRTAPVSGSAFNIGFLGCIDKSRDMSSIYRLQDRYHPLITCFMGDMPYMDKADQVGTSIYWGGITNTVRSDLNQTNFDDVDTYLNQYKSMWNVTCIKSLGHSSAIVIMPDDHEWGENDFSGGRIGQVSSATSLTWSQEHFDNVESVFNAVLQGNPPNTDAGIDLDAAYFRLPLNADIEIFMPDYIKYRAGFQGDGYGGLVSDTALGASQKAWLIGTSGDSPAYSTGVIHTSLSAHKIIASNKRFYPDYAEQDLDGGGIGERINEDGFHANEDERDDVVAGIQNTSGLSVVSSDRHNIAVFERTGATEYFEVSIGVAGVEPFKAQGNGFSSSHVTFRNNTRHGFGVAEIRGSSNIIFKACDNRGHALWTGERNYADNVVFYPQQNTTMSVGL